MEQVQTLEYSMIEKALDAIDADFEWSQEEEGDLYLNLGADPVAGCTIEAWLNIEGDENDVYAIRLQSDRYIPRSQWSQYIWLCNSWNRNNRYPTAYLDADMPDRPGVPSNTIGLPDNPELEVEPTAEIFLESYLYVASGIHQTLLDSFTDEVISAGLEFWGWARNEHGM